MSEPVGAILVRRDSREGVMFYSNDMIPDPNTIKDRFELITVYEHADPRVAELEAVLRECRKRLAFIDRLDDDRDFLYEPEWKQLHETISKIDEVLK